MYIVGSKIIISVVDWWELIKNQFWDVWVAYYKSAKTTKATLLPTTTLLYCFQVCGLCTCAMYMLQHVCNCIATLVSVDYTHLMCVHVCLRRYRIGEPEQALGWFPLGLEL